MVTDELSTTFAALADPTRRAILARLAQGEATVLELAEPFGLKLPTVSKHLKVLQRAGLVTQERRAQWRPCRLEAAPLKEVADWMENYRRFWDESYQRLDDYLRELQAREQAEKKRRTMVEKASGTPSLSISTPSDREIVVTRTFDAPRRLVFEAHSKPEHIRRWWGLRNSTMVVCEMDFRPGGAWRYVLREANGQENGFRGVYREITPPERIVWTFIFEPFPDNEAVETLVLTEHDGKTTITVTSVYDSKETRDAVIASGMEEGLRETWDRLAEYLQSIA